MDYKQSVKIVEELLNAVPRKYEDNRLELIHRYGYLISLLASIMADDFYAAQKVKRQHEKLTGKRN